MRAVLTNLGSMGDIQPLVTLAFELQRSGHYSVLALAPYFGNYVRSLGFEFSPIGPDLEYPELQRRDTSTVMRGAHDFNLMSESLTLLKAMLPDMFNGLMRVCWNADVLISGNLQMASRMIHELTGIPFVSVQLNHFGGRQSPQFRQAIASVVNQFRAQHGLEPVSDPKHTDANSPQLALYAMSQYFRPPSIDWPEHYHVTGFFFMDEESWDPDPALVEFIESGPPPVVFAFSSVAHEDADAWTRLLLEAILVAGRRAIIQRGWSGLAKGDLPPSVFAVDFIQHSWLFPLASCVVHHGGAGTMAAAVRSGVPAIIIPHIGDQILWAEMALGLGCASFVIPAAELDAERLGQAIATTLANEQFYRSVAEVAKKVRAEGGVKKARRLIEQLLSKIAGRVGAEKTPEQELIGQVELERVNRRKQYQQERRLRKRLN